MIDEEIANRFTYHPPTGQRQMELYEDIRQGAYVLANFIDAQCPDSREKALAITKLEEAVFWANAAIARHS